MFSRLFFLALLSRQEDFPSYSFNPKYDIMFSTYEFHKDTKINAQLYTINICKYVKQKRNNAATIGLKIQRIGM